jgi:hypothetical protein
VAVVLVCAGVGSSCSGQQAAARRITPPLRNGAAYAAYCQGPPGCPSGGVPSPLRRALRLPALGPGGRCPVAAPARRRAPGLGPMVGAGPVYALSEPSFDRRDRLAFPGLSAAGGWRGEKVLWAVRPGYHGPLLIRGRRIGGSGQVGFGLGPRPYDELDLAPAAGDPSLSGWRAYPSEVRVQAPGCYAWQVDGTSFRRVIVFRAVPAPP